MEYIALGQAMREVITFIELIKEVSFIFGIHLPNSEVFCKVFKDNNSCTAVADSNKLSPRTKNIAIKYHHFLIFVQKKIIRICYIYTREQKKRKLSLSYSMKHYSSIYKENYPDVDFKHGTFASTRGSLRIQRTTQTHKYNN